MWIVPAATETVFYSENFNPKKTALHCANWHIYEKKYVIAELSIYHLHLMDDVSDKYVHCYWYQRPHFISHFW